MTERVRIVCPYCHATRCVKLVAFRHVHHCKNCGAWAQNFGDADAPQYDWHTSDDAPPHAREDKAEIFRQYFAQLAPYNQAPQAEYRFHPVRQWRMDACWPECQLAVEIDGGNNMIRYGRNGQPVVVGRHTRDEDYEKINAAMELNWCVLRFTTSMLQRDPAGCVATVVRVYRKRMLMHETTEDSQNG